VGCNILNEFRKHKKHVRLIKMCYERCCSDKNSCDALSCDDGPNTRQCSLSLLFCFTLEYTDTATTATERHKSGTHM
jgi:hypothetical protein